ncbi:MAG: hypothetical protein V3U54_05355 [Thermodesulfobacteriota bacterium]
MTSNKDLNRLRVGDEICLFKKDGLLPITCGLLKHFDEKEDKVSIEVDEGSIVLTRHLYDLVSTSTLSDSGSKCSVEMLRRQFMQFSGIIKRESKR